MVLKEHLRLGEQAVENTILLSRPDLAFRCFRVNRRWTKSMLVVLHLLSEAVRRFQEAAALIAEERHQEIMGICRLKHAAIKRSSSPPSPKSSTG